MKKINVAIMGLGVVGGGTYEILTANHKLLKQTHGFDISVQKILDRTVENAIQKGAPNHIATQNLDDILSDKNISIVVETMGGIEPARSYILKCLQSGKSVVTANKELVSKHWGELEAVAKENKVGLYFEASCVGGVPVIRTLIDAMQANNVEQVMGIINGTTNYILTKMTEEGLDYDQALKQAQALGFAEADPTADVEGFDAAYKLSILSSLAFHKYVPYQLIFREGICKINASDIAAAKEMGFVIKLLAISKNNGGKIEARVHPAFVPVTHPIANVNGSFNAVFLHGDFADDLMLYGRGAGARPTASAIVSDIIYCAEQKSHKHPAFTKNQNPKIVDDFESKYYFSVKTLDQTGILAKITAVLGKEKISIEAIIQRGAAEGNAKIVFMTHLTKEKSMQTAISKIAQLEGIKEVESLIRVI